VKIYGKYGSKVSWIVKWYGKYGWKVSWIVKIYGKYGSKVSWIVKWYGKYGRKVSWIVKRYGKCGRKVSWIVKRWLLTDFVCLYNYEFGLSLCKIVRSSVILLLPLFTDTHNWKKAHVVFQFIMGKPTQRHSDYWTVNSMSYI
jgi:hypothetical protein